jgi:uncharacterized membrane protein YphA (DoxX/SURF4 family)
MSDLCSGDKAKQAVPAHEGAGPSQTGTAFAGREITMMTSASPTQNVANQLPAANGLAMVRLTIGAMFVWVFFENLGKGLYTPAGYASLISYYIKASHSPAAWKAVMGLMASHAAMAAPMQAMTEISLGILLVVGLLTRPVALVAFLYLASLWMSEWGTAWIWELLVPVLASLALAVGRAGRAWGVDALLARRWPSSLWW